MSVVLLGNYLILDLLLLGGYVQLESLECPRCQRVMSEVFQARDELPVPLACDGVQCEGLECADLESLIVLDPCLLLPERLYLCLRDSDLEPRQVPPNAHRIQYHYSTD